MYCGEENNNSVENPRDNRKKGEERNLRDIPQNVNHWHSKTHPSHVLLCIYGLWISRYLYTFQKESHI